MRDGKDGSPINERQSWVGSFCLAFIGVDIGLDRLVCSKIYKASHWRQLSTPVVSLVTSSGVIVSPENNHNGWWIQPIS